MSIQDVIVVGGGIGGTMTANNLVNKLYPEIRRGKVRVSLISNDPWHWYKPAFMYIAFGKIYKDELRRPLHTLLPPEVNLLMDEVQGFDFNASRLRLKSGKDHRYDYLVVSTGCVPSPERIPGLQEAGDHFYQHDPAMQLFEKLRVIEKGRVFVGVTFPKTPNVPHQCGIAPMETTLMLDEYLRARGVREQVEIVYTYPTVAQLLRNCLFLQRPVGEALPAIFDGKDIKHQTGFTLKEVDPGRKVAISEEGEEVEFDVLMQTPPIRAVDAVLDSGVSQAPNNEGWLPTNRQTLQLEGFDNVFVMGDTVDLPVSKAGGTAHNQSPVIANNIAGLLRLGKLVAEFDGKVQAIAQMGFSAGMPLWYDYEDDVMPLPATKIGSMMRNGFNRGVYWGVARGMV